MVRMLVRAFAVLVVAVLSLGIAAPVAAAPGDTIVEGTVVARAGGAPLAGVTVTLGRDGPTFTTITDVDGLFRFEDVGVLGNSTNVRYSLPGYENIGFFIGINEGATTTLYQLLALEANVTGTVTDAVTGDPIEGAEVTVGFRPPVYTAADGTYTFAGAGLSPYSGRLKIAAAGYGTQYFTVVATAGSTTSGKDAALAAESNIVGTVTDFATGLPLEGVEVEVMRPDTGLPDSVFTAADGTYTFAGKGLGVGNYFVRFSAPDLPGSVAVWWEDSVVLSGATPIPLVPGLTVDGIDVALEAFGHIVGPVREGGGGGINDVTVNAYRDGVIVASVITDVTGSYGLTLSPGDYKFEFIPRSGSMYLPEFWDDESTLATADIVTVAAGDKVTISPTLAVAEFPFITGTVALEGLADPSTVSVVAIRSSGSEYARTNPDSSGAYTLMVPPGGATTIYFEAPAGYESKYWDDVVTAAAATPLTLSYGQTLGGIDAELEVGAVIEGIIDVAGGGGVANPVEVIAYRWTGTEFEYSGKTAVITPGFPGTYRIEGLTRGIYTIGVEPVVATPSIYCTQFYDDELSLEDADSFDLESGEIITGIDATLRVDCDPSGSPTVAASATTTAAGTTVEVSGEHFAPGETVEFELHSTPIPLGSVIADGDGAFAATLTIPSTAPPGPHSIVALGADSAMSASVAITIDPAAPPRPALTATGSTVSLGIGYAGGVLLLLGACLVLARRAKREA